MGAMRTYALFIATFVCGASLLAQDASLPAPPDVVGVPFYLDSAAGQLKKLASEAYKNHNPVPGTFTMTQAVEMKGAASAFRIPSQNKIVFVYDATTIPRLYKFTVHGSKRKFEYGKVNALNSTPVEGLSISVSRYKETAYQFSADQPLTAGEYAILFPDRIYTFGVDEKK
jgi:hypothetical protein